MKSHTITTYLLISLVFFLASCSAGFQNAPTPTPLPAVVNEEKITFNVERGSITSKRESSGQIVPLRQDQLFFRASGYINRVLVNKGESFKKGDILAELQVEDLLDQLQQAQIDLRVAQDNYNAEKLQKEYDIQKAESDVLILQKQADLVKDRLEKTSSTQKDEVQAELDIALERLKTAQAWLDLVKSKNSLASDQMVQRYKLSVERLERLISERQIIAPYDGIVLVSTVFPGNQAEAYAPAMVIGDPSELVVQIPFDYDLNQILDPSTPALMFPSKLSEESYPVEYIPDFMALTNEKEGITVRGDDITVNYFYFSLPESIPADQIEVGKMVRLQIVMGSKENALLLHPAALRGNDAFKYIIILEDDTHRRVEVVNIGLKTTDRWEIIADVKEGDLVLGP